MPQNFSDYFQCQLKRYRIPLNGSRIKMHLTAAMSAFSRLQKDLDKVGVQQVGPKHLAALNLKVGLASDHAGFGLKNELILAHKLLGLEAEDFGPYQIHEGITYDFPLLILPAITDLQAGNSQRAVLTCGSGIGVCIGANRFSNIRATVGNLPEEIIGARQHNDINVLTLGERRLFPNGTGTDGLESAYRALGAFYLTPFLRSPARYQDRMRQTSLLAQLNGIPLLSAIELEPTLARLWVYAGGKGLSSRGEKRITEALINFERYLIHGKKDRDYLSHLKYILGELNARRKSIGPKNLQRLNAFIRDCQRELSDPTSS